MQTQKKNQKKPFADAQIAKLVSYCPFCSTSFSPEKASVVGESRESWLLHVTCQHCASSIVLLLLIGEVGVSSFGLVTDLTEKDVGRFRNSETVSNNDLIDLYQLLCQGDRHFISLL